MKSDSVEIIVYQDNEYNPDKRIVYYFDYCIISSGSLYPNLIKPTLNDSIT